MRVLTLSVTPPQALGHRGEITCLITEEPREPFPDRADW